MTYSYDSAGNLTGVKDVGGAWTYYGYDSAHHLTTVDDADGHTTTIGYTNSLATSETDPLNRVTSWSYTTNPGGNGTTTVTDPLGYQTSDTITAGQLTSQTDAAGTGAAATTTYTYDPTTGGVAQKTTAAGTTQAETTHTSYDSAGNVASVTDPDLQTSTNTYTAQNLIHTATKPSQACTQYSYPSGSSSPSEVDQYSGACPANGGTGGARSAMILSYGSQPSNPTQVSTNGQPAMIYAYNGDGDTLSATDPLLNETTYGYNILGEKTSGVAPRGNVTGDNRAEFTTTYAYDTYGNTTQTTNPAGDSTSATYDPLGRELTSIDADGNVTTNVYDADGELSKTTQPDGTTLTYSYDGDGRKTAETDANGKTTTYTYDPRGNQLTETDPLGHVTTDTYDLNSNKATETEPDGNTTTDTYDGNNQLTGVTRPDGTTLAYGYDADGNKTSYTDAAGDTTRYGYNSLDQETSVTDPAGRVTSYTYDANGNKATETNPDGQNTTWVHDADNQVTSVAYSNDAADNTTYTYDADGNKTTMVDGTGTTSYTYDNDDRLSGEQNGAGANVGYGYDPAGNVTAITYPNGNSVTEAYNKVNELSSVTDWDHHTTTFVYDAAGNQTGTAFPNGTTESTAFDAAGDPNETDVVLSDTTSLSFAYHDPDGQITRETDTGTADPGTTNYTYNPLNQLTAAGSNTYTYDQANNLTTGPNGTTQAFNADGQICWSATGAGSCASPPAGATIYSYTPEGNRATTDPATGTSDTYTWTQTNRLASLTPTAGTATTYSYDADGLLQHETTGTTTATLTWDTQSSLPLLLADGTNEYIYGLSSTPIEQISAATDTPSYVIADQLGSVRSLTNPAGSVTAAYTYDAWGDVTGNTTTTSNPIGYAGQYTDPTSGLIYMRTRWYDPTTGQFLSQDPALGQTHAPYSYTDNNPVQYTDPAGTWKVLSRLFTGHADRLGTRLNIYLGSLNRNEQRAHLVRVVFEIDPSALGRVNEEGGHVRVGAANGSQGYKRVNWWDVHFRGKYKIHTSILISPGTFYWYSGEIDYYVGGSDWWGVGTAPSLRSYHKWYPWL